VPAPYDRRVKIIVLTKEGRSVAKQIDSILAVPPAAFSALSQAELRQLRDLLDKVLSAQEQAGGDAAGNDRMEGRAAAHQAKLPLLEPVRLH
jgi:DNA-binding MarR family transcriptional regulator